MNILIINKDTDRNLSVGFCMVCKEIVPIKSIQYIDDINGQGYVDNKLKCMKCGKTDFPEPLPPGC